MDDKPTITAGLRDAVRHFTNFHQEKRVEMDERVFNDMCDAIDSIHSRVCSELDDATREGHEWVDSYERMKRERDAIAAELDRLQSECDHDGWIELPKDADGVPIHVGDMMERGEVLGYVIALMLSEYPKKWGGGLHWGVQLEGEHAPTALDLTFHHYHEPTVEDVLREFAVKMNESIGLYVGEVIDVDELHSADAKTIAEYAAKLREVMPDER